MSYQPHFQTACALFVFALISFSSCKNDFPEEYPEFVGTWFNESKSITIDQDGNGDYEYISPTGSYTTESEASGKVKIKDDVLSIGSGLFRMRFDIDVYPTQVEVDFNVFNTFIVLDGDTLFYFPKVDNNPDFTCTNGIWDTGEKELDCGGVCPKCVSCHDSIMNQDEKGVDCGGVCVACAKGSCFDDLAEGEVELAYCDTIYGAQQIEISSYTVDTLGLAPYMVDAKAYSDINEYHIMIHLPEKPTYSRTYKLKPWNQYYGGSSDEVAELIFYRGTATYISSKCNFEEGPTLYVNVLDGKVTATFCNINFTCGFPNCRYGSAKLSWEL